MSGFAVDLGGKTALVTGASSGLGEHFARTLARAGAEVVVAARRLDRLHALVESIESEGGLARAVAMDVAEPDSLTKAFAGLSGLDIVINNAGVTLTKTALEHDLTDWNRVLGTNLTGAFFVAQAAAKAMSLRAGGGSIVNIASILGLRQASQLAAYSVSKAGLVQMTKALALEWARHGVRVNALCPGYISTELNEAFWQTEAGQALVRRIPQRRLGTPEDLDGPLLLLASDASRFMTGVEIVVDGGHLVSGL